MGTDLLGRVRPFFVVWTEGGEVVGGSPPKKQIMRAAGCDGGEML